MASDETQQKEDACIKPDAQESTPTVVMARPDLPAIWFDVMRVTRRTSDDGHQTTIFSFAQAMPDLQPEFGGAEVARLITTEGQVRKMIDAMCKNSGYYPERP